MAYSHWTEARPGQGQETNRLYEFLVWNYVEAFTLHLTQDKGRDLIDPHCTGPGPCSCLDTGSAQCEYTIMKQIFCEYGCHHAPISSFYLHMIWSNVHSKKNYKNSFYSKTVVHDSIKFDVYLWGTSVVLFTKSGISIFKTVAKTAAQRWWQQWQQRIHDCISSLWLLRKVSQKGIVK